ncbi:Splicing regulator SDE2 [Formica fusca]|uniref:replication stress response regulator SDE2 isoform X1 n=2 Tax=Formica exsecta TaxID=72781 RepID=UPI00114424F2|nr:replication stress response regulator SDE2 isoform X1 [Formica exsecta]
MLNVKIAGASVKCVINNDTPIAVYELWQRVEEETGLLRDQYYIVHNGRLMQKDDICTSGYATIVPRLLGGKGGFGSMLRAIGAQIEKTTNREACRDLSGRRLRDINEEKRLKAWIEKQTKRHDEEAERKRKKLEKLCAEPRHEFKDQRYEQERAKLPEKVEDAVEEGFKAATVSGVKRKSEKDVQTNKRKTILDFEIDSDEFEDTSDDSDNDNSDGNDTAAKKSKTEQRTLTDSGNSSDDTGKIGESTEKIESEHSESSIDNEINNKVSSNESVDPKCIVDSTETPEDQYVDSRKETAV